MTVIKWNGCSGAAFNFFLVYITSTLHHYKKKYEKMAMKMFALAFLCLFNILLKNHNDTVLDFWQNQTNVERENKV